MKKIKYIFMSTFLSVVIMISLSSCRQKTAVVSSKPGDVNQSFASQPQTTDEDFFAAVSSVPDQSRPDYLNSLSIDSAPIDLNDLEKVRTAYISPLISTGGSVWFYTWNTVREIKPDDLILICGMRNYLNLPRDFEGGYSTEEQNVSSVRVESAIKEHFNVESDYLKTSSFYNAQDDTYLLIGAGGGRWWATPISVKQKGGQLTIEVGILWSDDERKLLPGEVKTSEGILTPKGTLILELVEGKPSKYISYKLYN